MTGGPLGPDEPEGPNARWFAEGTVDPRKWDPYLFDPDHPANGGKAEGWRRTFGVGKGDGPFVERLIREQIDGASIETVGITRHKEYPGKATRRWNLLIPTFEVPGRRPALLLTVWGLDPDKERPHLVTAVPRP